MKAVVVGTGVGALASALRLRAMGLDVDVLEACPDAGGRARTFNFHGHSFDAGPTVITAPWLFDELFELFGERRFEYVEFLPVILGIDSLSQMEVLLTLFPIRLGRWMKSHGYVPPTRSYIHLFSSIVRSFTV